MLKQIVLLKRRPGMSMEEFREYYETKHALLGEKYMPKARRYVRRYVVPEPNPITYTVEELDFDVVLEIWWDSRVDFEETMAAIGTGEAHELFVEDEKRLFDRHNNRVFTVDEVDSVLPRSGEDD